MNADTMTIGALALEAGVNVETVRYYHRIGLLPQPARAYGRRRRYDDDGLQRLQFIKRAQHLGFSLQEIAHLLEFSDSRHCAETRELAAEKLQSVERKIADLKAMQQTLAGLVKACGRRSGARGCPIIESLQHEVRGVRPGDSSGSRPRG